MPEPLEPQTAVCTAEMYSKKSVLAAPSPAAEVEQPVHEQHTHLVAYRVAALGRLPLRDVDANDDVADVVVVILREGEHVGGPIDLAVPLVEMADGIVIAERERELDGELCGC